MGIRIAIVDDHPCFTTGLRLALEHCARDFNVVAVAHSAAEALETVREAQPDVVLMDIAMPDRDGIEVTRDIKLKWPHIKVIVLSASDAAMDIVRALDAGIGGYLLKQLDALEIVNAIRAAHDGGLVFAPSVGEIIARWVETPRDGRLTEAEVSILRLISEGRRNGELATSMSLSATTVNRVVKSAIEKLGAASRSQATAVAVRRGLI